MACLCWVRPTRCEVQLNGTKATCGQSVLLETPTRTAVETEANHIHMDIMLFLLWSCYSSNCDLVERKVSSYFNRFEGANSARPRYQART